MHVHDKYNRWIKQNMRGRPVARVCAEATPVMLRAFPELRRVRGHYVCPMGRRYPHWWCETSAGHVVDPTADQFPSLGYGEYEPLPDKAPEPLGKCLECGAPCWPGPGASALFCSTACAASAAALLNEGGT